MLIEFTGCTGTGKTTMVKKTKEKLVKSGINTVTSEEFLFGSFFEQIRVPRIKNFIIDFLVFPWVLVSLRRNARFLYFVIKTLSHKQDSFLGAINRFRSVMRKIGTYELIRFKEKNLEDRIILVDEGIIHAAHNIFVYASFPIISKDISYFLSLVSLPDRLIIVNAPADVIMERTKNRIDPPARFEPRHLIGKYIERGLEVFNKIVEVAGINERFLVVGLQGSLDKEMEAQAQKISDFILNARPNL